MQACVHVCVKSTDSIVHVLYCLSKIKQTVLFLNFCVFRKSYTVADKYVAVKSQPCIDLWLELDLFSKNIMEKCKTQLVRFSTQCLTGIFLVTVLTGALMCLHLENVGVNLVFKKVQKFQPPPPQL